jgi:hypothetical protein
LPRVICNTSLPLTAIACGLMPAAIARPLRNEAATVDVRGRIPSRTGAAGRAATVKDFRGLEFRTQPMRPPGR